MDNIPQAFLSWTAAVCGNVLFVGENTFTITGLTDASGLPEPLDKLRGNFYVDASGALYQLDSTDHTASLIYVPAEKVTDGKWEKAPLTAYTVPASVTADGTAYTVDAVGKMAFTKAANLETLNGETEMDEAAAALADMGFTGVILTHTKHDTTEEESDYPAGGSVTAYGVNEDATVLFVTEIGGEVEDGTTVTVSVGDKDLLTNETSDIVVSLSNTAAHTSKRVRVYFAFADPDYSFTGAPLGIEQSSTDADNSYNYTLNKIEGKDIYYLDMGPVAEGKTGSLSFAAVYPSPNSPGGELKMWAEILPEEQTPAPDLTLGEDDPCLMATWDTVADPFTLKKTVPTANSSQPKITKVDTDYFITNLNYTLSLTRVGDTNTYGENHVETVEFKDELSLPTGIKWRDGLAELIATGIEGVDWRADMSTPNIGRVYVNIDGAWVELCAVKGAGLERVWPTVEDGKIVIRWETQNLNRTLEYSMGTGTVVFGDSVLMLDSEVTIQGGSKLTIDNTAKAKLHYRHDGLESEWLTSTVPVSVTVGQGAVAVSKERVTDTTYWAENATYYVRVYNNTAYPYNSVDYTRDKLGTIQYIKPSNMARMYASDTFNELSITITNATLCYGNYVPEQITAVDGKTHDYTSITNSTMDEYERYSGCEDTVGDVDEHNNANTLVLRWNTGKTALELLVNDVVTVENISPTEAGIAAALEQVHYMPNNLCRYECRWTHEGDRRTVQGNEYRYFYVYATNKDTLTYLANDTPGTHTLTAYSRYTNYGYLKRSGYSSELQTSGTAASSNAELKRELSLSKVVRQNGKTIGSGNLLKDESVLENTLTVKHSGTGVYDLLPVTDRMTGAQLAMARWDKNRGASWTAGLDTVEYHSELYYLLTEGTYEGVWRGDFYADSVTVTKSGDSFDTLIKWYFSDTLNKAFTQDTTNIRWAADTR